jgi:hypothetical protein
MAPIDTAFIPSFIKIGLLICQNTDRHVQNHEQSRLGPEEPPPYTQVRGTKFALVDVFLSCSFFPTGLKLRSLF